MAVTIPDVSQLVSVDSYVGEDDQETLLGAELVRECVSYLEHFPWCERVLSGYVGLLIPPVIGVVLFEIAPLRGADPWIWVVGGDLPSMFLEFDDEYTPDAESALDCYVGNMESWVSVVIAGGAPGDVFPVDAAPTVQNATLLRQRLAFIDTEILRDRRRGPKG